MDRESVKLELLKLVNRPDHSAGEMIAKAEILENYVFSDSKPAQSKPGIKPVKKSDTADLLG